MNFWEGKKLLVTGGAGLLGSHVVELLVKYRADVTVVDNLQRGKIENLKAIRDKISFIQADLRDPTVCQVVTVDKDVVLNIAANVAGIGYNVAHNMDMFADNVLVNTNVLEFSRKNHVGRFLVVSSACIYPADALVPTPEAEAGKGRPEKTNEGYGWAKYMSEIQAQYIARETDMKIAIVRPFNFYGPRDYFDPQISHVIPALIKKILDGDDPAVVWGTGDQTRAFTHVRDTARALLLVTEKYPNADAVNIGDDKEIPIKKLVNLTLKITGRKTSIQYRPDMPMGYHHRAADITKLQKVTGFVPQIPLQVGLREVIDWYKNTL